MKKNVKKIMIAGNIVVVAICIFLFSLNSLSVLSNALYDFSMRTAKADSPDERILVVAIDSESLQEIGTFPFDRKYYAQAIANLEKGNPKVIAFDVMFHQASNAESDNVLAAELAKHQNVIFPVTAILEGTFSRSTTVKRDQLLMAKDVDRSIPLFEKVTQAAHINANVDSDNSIRHTWLKLDTPDAGVYPSLAYKAVEMAGVDASHFLTYNPQTEILIDYQAKSFDFETIPFFRIVNDEIPSSVFEDRIILVGYTAPGSDRGRTPVEKSMSLVYAHANIINQLLKDIHIQTVDRWILFTSMLFMILLVGLLTWRLKSTIVGVSIVLGITVALFLFSFFYFKQANIFFDPIYLLTAGYLAYLFNIAVKSYFETRQKNFITKQFGRYISPDLVDQIAGSDQELQLGGINKELSILFLDIRGFTTLSEKLNPEEVVDFLNTMFDMITHATLNNKGTIDKFIGDAAMLLFNAPLDLEHHEYYAVKTAYDIQQGMQKVRGEILEKHHVTISIGIGVNTGVVVVGNIGSYLRVDYTAIGDNVNIASRIESNTVANQILVSEETYERTKDYFEYEFAGERTVKGKTLPLKLYEVKAMKTSPEALPAGS